MVSTSMLKTVTTRRFVRAMAIKAALLSLLTESEKFCLYAMSHKA